MGRNKAILRRRLCAEEDVEHERDAFEAEHVISNTTRYLCIFPSTEDMTCLPIRGYLDLELRGLLLAIDYRTLGVRCLEILNHCMDYPMR